MGVKCYWMEPMRQARLKLRRYSSSTPCPLMPGEHSYHDAENPLYDVKETFVFQEHWQSKIYQHEGPHERSEVPSNYAWPTACACGYEFTEEDNWQVFSDHLYRRTDTGEILTLREAGPGAMYYAEWLEERPYRHCGPDGHSVVVHCPDGRMWMIDGRANNCTMPDEQTHNCWIRHGEPPMLTVDKNGNTCAAGGGSIDTGTYHGFLVNGEFNP